MPPAIKVLHKANTQKMLNFAINNCKMIEVDVSYCPHKNSLVLCHDPETLVIQGESDKMLLLSTLKNYSLPVILDCKVTPSYFKQFLTLLHKFLTENTGQEFYICSFDHYFIYGLLDLGKLSNNHYYGLICGSQQYKHFIFNNSKKLLDFMSLSKRCYHEYLSRHGNKNKMIFVYTLQPGDKITNHHNLAGVIVDDLLITDYLS